MNGPAARYAFLPWLRRGVSAAAGAGASLDRRLQLPVDVSFGEGRAASARLALLGPGDVVGLDRRVVARTWPRANVLDAEPNYFPMAEFDQADLPWRYTPVLAPDGDRLPPWLCLLVLADAEIGARVPPGATRPLPAIEVVDAPLPRLDQGWAWAHAQVAGVDAITAADAALLLATEPHRLTAQFRVRLIQTEIRQRRRKVRPHRWPKPPYAPAFLIDEEQRLPARDLTDLGRQRRHLLHAPARAAHECLVYDPHAGQADVERIPGVCTDTASAPARAPLLI